VVLQVVADLEVPEHGDAERPEVLGGADAAVHEDGRRAEGAGRQDHLLAGEHALPPAVLDELDAERSHALGLHQHPADGGELGHVQVRPVAHWHQVGAVRAEAGAVAHGRFNELVACLCGAVVVDHVVAHLLAGGDETLGQWRVPRRVCDRQRAADAPNFVVSKYIQN
jgi:hypothetical protein